MLLEAGLKKDDDNKVRRWSAGISGNTTYVSYEEWLKRLGVGLFSFWVVFALFYLSSSSSSSSSAPASVLDGVTKNGVAAAQSNNNIKAKSTMGSPFPDETNFIVIGDYGTGSADQVQTADALKNFASTLNPRPAFVISTGDQIYEHGYELIPGNLFITLYYLFKGA